MKQTQTQETEYLLRFEPFLRRQVRNFLPSRGGMDCAELDDLMQEARLAFLMHLREIPDAEPVHLCQKSIYGALCAHCRRMAPVAIPKNCFGEEIGKLRRMDYGDALQEYEQSRAVGTEQVALLHDFEASLTEQERIALKMKRDGYSNREIIPFIGVAGDVQASRLMHRVIMKARAYFAD